MVSFPEGDSTPPAKNSIPHSVNGLHNPAPAKFSVIIPVYMKVTLPAEDELAAEVHAIAALRKLHGSTMEIGGGVSLNFQAVIAPVVAKPS